MARSFTTDPAGAVSKGVGRPLWREPVVLWGIVGALFMAVAAWVLVRWALAGGIHSVDSRPYAISTTRKAILWAWQALIGIGFLTAAVYFVRQCRRRQTITFEAALFAMGPLMSWMAPILQYAGTPMLVSKYVINVSSWGPYIPGYHGPDPAIAPVGILSSDVIAWWVFVLWFLLARDILDRLCPPRRPWSLGTLIAVTIVISIAVEIILEPAWILTGSWAYAPADPGPALFGGHWHQVPLFEIPLMGCWFVPFLVMDRIARDRGTEPVLFHGSDRLPPHIRPWARVLSVTGFASVLLFIWICIIAATLTGPGQHINPDMPDHITPGSR